MMTQLAIGMIYMYKFFCWFREILSIFSCVYSSLDAGKILNTQFIGGFLKIIFKLRGRNCFVGIQEVVLTLIRAAIKKSIEWRLQVQLAFLTEVNLAPSRPE
jgi:hypothetical protein